MHFSRVTSSCSVNTMKTLLRRALPCVRVCLFTAAQSSRVLLCCVVILFYTHTQPRVAQQLGSVGAHQCRCSPVSVLAHHCSFDVIKAIVLTLLSARRRTTAVTVGLSALWVLLHGYLPS